MDHVEAMTHLIKEKEMTPIEVGTKVELSKVAKVNAAVKEIYGTTEFAVDHDALRSLLADQGIAEGFDEALAQVEARIAVLDESTR